MKYHGEYEVDPAFIGGGVINWQLTGNGEYIIGIRDGKKYFIKRNIHVRYPKKSEPKTVYDKNKAEADAIYNKQTDLRKHMSGLSCEKDHIITEQTNFWDDEHMFTTVTPFVSSALPETFDYSKLSLDEFLNLSKGFAELLRKLHGKNIIHGDLKEKNVLVVKKGGQYIPYLIDFDSSYLTSKIPIWDAIGGTKGYQSPENLLYGSDEHAAESSIITPETDIFSMAVVMHRWWTGAFPGVDIEKGTVGDAVYLGKPVNISKKFDVKIGDNCGATLISLMNWMLAKDPAARPSAEQVETVLSDKMAVPEEYQKGCDERPFDTELWQTHKLIAELCTVDELKKKGIKSLKRENTGRAISGLQYHVVKDDGENYTISIDDMIKFGYAKVIPAVVDEPWEEDCIELISPEEISAKGYCRIKRVNLSFRKRYLITNNTGTEFDRGYSWLIAEGLAKPKVVEIDSDIPWPEHGTAYAPENMARFGVKSISRVEVAGEHRYKIVYNELIDGKNRVNDRVAGNNLKIMGFIK